MFDLRDVLTESIPPIKVIDVGAMALPGQSHTYAPLLKLGNVQVIGFEPVAAECEKLQQNAGAGRTFLPYAIGDGTRRPFHTCNRSMTSSLYEPNLPLVGLFQNLEPHMQVVNVEDLQTHRLDDIAPVAGADLLKLDVQGAEVDVLNGAQQLLKSLLVVQTEVEFVPLYKNQPLFADVDQALRSAGFAFHKFLGVAGRAFQPVVINNDVNHMGSQMLWTDVVYVRDFLSLNTLSPPQLLKLAAILHYVYGSIDYAQFVLKHYDAQRGTMFQAAYMQRLAGPRRPASR